MSRPAPPALTVRYDGSTRTFAPGNDVVVGRDLRADVRIAHPLISRAHLVLRFDQGRWVAIDNGSLNGMYVNGRRVPAVDIRTACRSTSAIPTVRGLTFEVGRHQGSAGTPPPTTSVPRRVSGRAHPAAGAATANARPPSASRSAADVPVGPAAAAYPPGPQAYPAPAARRPIRARRSVCAERTRRRPSRPRVRVSRSPPRRWNRSPRWVRPPRRASERQGNLATSMLKILRPGQPADGPAGCDQDRPRDRQRHRHPRRAGVAPPRDADRRPRAAPRSATTAASTARSSTARASSPRCCTTATSSPSATSTWCSAAAPWSAAPRPRPPPAPAASRSTASRGPSRATRRCSTTSRCRRGPAR